MLHYVSSCPSILPFRANIFISLRKNTQRIQQAITATNRLHVYILGEIGIGTRKQETREIRIDVNRFCRDVKHVLTPSERIHKFHCTDDDICDRGYHITLINIFQLQILYKYIKNFTAIFLIHKT